MSKVFFSTDYKKIVEKIDESKLKGKVGIKVHFGEKGNETYLNPEIAKAVYDKVTSLGHESSLVECNVLYKGSRTKREDHVKTAVDHGFGFAPIDILDGEMGEKEVKMKVKKGKIKEARIGGGITQYDSLIVLSHFKGHASAGFGGAFKNLGMGLGSRAGKLHMHSHVNPSVDDSRCTGCGLCVKNCDFDAISIIKSKAVLKDEKCSGCAMCIAVCPQKAIKIPWGGSTNKELQEKIVDYSSALINYFENNLVYINVLEDITKDCDCAGKKMTPVVEDIGLLFSLDPVALEKASLDLVNEKSNNEFGRINEVDKDYKIKYAEEIGLGIKDYKIYEK